MIQELQDILDALVIIEEKIAEITSSFTIPVDTYLYKVKNSVLQLKIKLSRYEKDENVEKAIITGFQNDLKIIEEEALHNFHQTLAYEAKDLVIKEDSSLENNANTSNLTKLNSFLVNFKKAIPGHNEACITRLNNFILTKLNTTVTTNDTAKNIISTRIDQINATIQKIETDKNTICFSDHEMEPWLAMPDLGKRAKQKKATPRSTPPNEKATSVNNDNGNKVKIVQKMSTTGTQTIGQIVPRDRKSEQRTSLIQKIAEMEKLVLQPEDLNKYCELDSVLIKNQQLFKDLENQSAILISNLQSLLNNDLREIDSSELETAIKRVSELTTKKSELKTSILARQKLLIPTAEELGLGKELDKKNLECLLARDKTVLMKALTQFLNVINELNFSEYNEHPNEPLAKLKEFIQEIREDLRTESWTKTNYLPCNKKAVEVFFDDLLLKHTNSTKKQPAPLKKTLIDGFIEEAFVIVISPYKALTLWGYESDEDALKKRIVALRGLHERVTSYPIHEVKKAIADKHQEHLDLIAKNLEASSIMDKLDKDLVTQHTTIISKKIELKSTIKNANEKLLAQKVLFSAKQSEKRNLASNPLDKSSDAISKLESHNQALANIKIPDKDADIEVFSDGSTKTTREQLAALRELQGLETEINSTVKETDLLYDQLVALYNSDKKALITELETLISHAKDIFKVTYNLELVIKQLNSLDPLTDYKTCLTNGQANEMYLDICEAWILKNFKELKEKKQQIENFGKIFNKTILSADDLNCLNAIDLRLVKLWTVFQIRRVEKLFDKADEAVIELNKPSQNPKLFYKLEEIQEYRLEELNEIIIAAKAKLTTDKTAALKTLSTSCGELKIPKLSEENPFALALNQKLLNAETDRAKATKQINKLAGCQPSELKVLVEKINATLAKTSNTIDAWGDALEKANTIEARLGADKSKEYATSIDIIEKMEEHYTKISDSYLEKHVPDHERKEHKDRLQEYLELASLNATALSYLNTMDKRLVKLWSIRNEFLQINNDYINENLDFKQLAFDRKINKLKAEFVTMVRDNIDKAIEANQGNKDLADFKTKDLNYLYNKYFPIEGDKELLDLINPNLYELLQTIHRQTLYPGSEKKCYINLLLDRVNAHLHNNQMEHFSEVERNAFVQFIRIWVLRPLQALCHWLGSFCGQDDGRHFVTFFAAPIERDLVEHGNKVVEDLASAFADAR